MTQADLAKGGHATEPPAKPSNGESANRYVVVDSILAKRGYDRAELIGVLQDIQGVYHYLPEELLTYVAIALRMKPATVFGVATFYAQFSLEPKGKYVVKVCDGTACHVKNSEAIYRAIRKKLKLADNKQTTADRLFTVEVVRCLGACSIAPAMVINDQVHPKLTPEAAGVIIDTLLERELGDQGENGDGETSTEDAVVSSKGGAQ
ncbi:MAG: complex I 24 kDa subunit family protein [Chloroflexota bacterium]|jgi:NADH-quinone oxidoreductase subunit E